jgi:hypothetical protein
MSETAASVDKLEKANHTYSTPNYWDPLETTLEEEEDEEVKEEEQALVAIDQPKSAAKQETMIIDAGATTHFATNTMMLRRTGKPSKRYTYQTAPVPSLEDR